MEPLIILVILLLLVAITGLAGAGLYFSRIKVNRCNSLVHFASYIFYTDVDDQLFDSHITQVSNEYSIL